MERKQILALAEKCVCGDREQDYGSPERSFEVIANLWSDYLAARGLIQEFFLDPKDVAAMMCLFKIGRIATGRTKIDNWVDLAGYAACGGETDGGVNG